MDRTFPAGAICGFLVAALSGCVGNGGGSLGLTIPGHESLRSGEARSSLSRDGVFSTGETAAPDTPIGQGGDSSFSGVLAASDTTLSQGPQGPGPDLFGARASSAARADTSGDGPTDRGSSPSGGASIAGTGPGGLSLAEHSRDNPEAADLLDHWGQRRVQSIVEGLSLSRAAAAQADGTGSNGLRAAARTGAGEMLPRALRDNVEIRVLGARRGVTYGRWTNGPADTLSIDFDLSRARPEMRDDPAFRAILERAGKAWSRRIADTWPTWERAPGDIKGLLWSDTGPEIEVRIGAEGETGARLEIDVTEDDLDGGHAGKGGSSGREAPGRPWEPRFGTIRIDRAYLEDAGERDLFATLAHEIGHVLGAWTTGGDSERLESHIDSVSGTWTGPNVVALHGGPASFQDAANPYAWVDGERNPQASAYDFDHSGVCSSIMAYCSFRSPQPALLPHAIDFAFLADFGMTVTGEIDGPETYGLAGWTDHAGFSISVSRDLQVGLSDGQSRSDRRARYPTALDFTDLLEADADVFGYPSFGDLRQSYPAAGLHGTVRYAGGLLGAAIGRAGLPPVTGDSSLAVNLVTLDGTASFTSLAVYPDGAPEIFAGGSLYYPFELSANAIIGFDAESTLRANFYGPRHESVAGELHDPHAELLASFGAIHDDRPSREDVVSAADYILGSSYRSGAADPADDGWSGYRCATASACAYRHAGSDGWTEWTTATRSEVLASTAGWRWRSIEIPHADLDFVRIERQSVESTDSVQGRRVVDGYAGTLEHAAFASGLQSHARLLMDPNDALSDTGDFVNGWAGIQGTLSGVRPDEVARWSGPMLGYQGGRPAGETPFVEGLASIDFSLSDNRMDVVFSEVASRDGQRDLPDFAFEDLQVEEDGTFGSADTAGTMDGALFGPSQVEVAGAFHHDTTEVTGSFGARRVPGTVVLEDGGPAAPPPPVVNVGGALHVGADAAPAPDQLATGRDYGGVAVSYGRVHDGAGAERVIEYLKQHIDAQGRYGATTPGLPTFPDLPTVRMAEGTREEYAAYVEQAVQLINTALPYDKRIQFNSEPASPLTAIEDVPDGQIFIDFAPSADGWDLGVGHGHYIGRVAVAEIDPNSEFNPTAQRWEYTGMRAGHMWFASDVLETHLNTAWVWNRDDGTWKRELLESRVVESDTLAHYYPDAYFLSITAYGLLRALGFLRQVDHSEFPDSMVSDRAFPYIKHLPEIDGEALLAAYGRLAPGTQPEDLSAESLGPWDDTSFHLRGDLDFAGGEASFGVAFRNGLARPWASGTEPLARLENDSALSGTVGWNGALLGMTPSAETVAGTVRLTVELQTLDAELDISGLEHWSVKEAPGEAGTGTTWGGGALEYSIEVDGNSFHRIGGDEGEVVGAFFGAAHEAMGGVLERSDLFAGFGGVR